MYWKLITQKMTSLIKDFLKLESASGIILLFTAILAMIMANSPLSHWYDMLLDVPVEIRIGELVIAKPLLLWINDGLMALFFFLIGLELKREVLEGELAEPKNIVLPALGAVGGMLVPGMIYVAFNYSDPEAIKGWAIPAATDIAFALGILLLLGKKVPLSLKIFLVSLAIFDDVGAIVIIAIFYTSNLSVLSLVVAAFCIVVLYILNRRGVMEIMPYLLIGLIMWVAVLKSGVHATLAGIICAFFIPLRNAKSPKNSPLRDLEHSLHASVAFGVLPLFAFANAGISLNGVDLDALLHPVPLGICVGLFIGKQLGVFLFCWAGVKLGIAQLPKGMTWQSLYGVAILCGIGFTMSLFIGSLAFEDMGADLAFDDRLGIVLGSFFSGVVGYFYLRWTLNQPEKPAYGRQRHQR